MTVPLPAVVAGMPMPGPRPVLDAGFAEVVRALTTVVADVEQARHPDLDLLAGAVSGCVRVTGLLASLAGTLGEHAHRSADEVGLLDVAADLATMRSLLHRATLVAAPAIADLRRYRIHSVG